MIEKKHVTLILDSFTPSDMNFLLPKVILEKKIHKKSTPLDHSYLKYTLASSLMESAAEEFKFWASWATLKRRNNKRFGKTV